MNKKYIILGLIIIIIFIIFSDQDKEESAQGNISETIDQLLKEESNPSEVISVENLLDEAVLDKDEFKKESYQELVEEFIIPQISIVEDKPIITEEKCHPSYTGACLKPDASDYDCIGGSGNGPYYTGTVRVVGPDVFGLDRDKDGWGCE